MSLTDLYSTLQTPLKLSPRHLDTQGFLQKSPSARPFTNIINDNVHVVGMAQVIADEGGHIRESSTSFVIL